MTTLEVIDAVQRSLHTEGFLQNIRAQLRAKVFQIISKGPDYTSKSESTINFSKTESGIISLMIVRDLLQNLNFKETLSVFEIETGIESQNRYKNEEIEKMLKIDSKFSTGYCILERIVNSVITETNFELNASDFGVIENKLADDSSLQLHEDQNTDENKDSYNNDYNEMKMSESKNDNKNDKLNLTNVDQNDVNKASEVASIHEEVEEEDIQEEVPEYDESDEEYHAITKVSPQKAEDIYIDDTSSPKQSLPPITNRIFVKGKNEFDLSDITSKANVLKLNQNLTSRSQKGWNSLDENSNDDDFSIEKEPAEMKLGKNSTDIILDEFDDDDKNSDNDNIRIDKDNNESVLNYSYRSNQEEEENTSYRNQKAKQAFENSLSDKNNCVQFDDEEYADEDFDEDFEEEEDGNINTAIGNYRETESIDEEIISVEEELSIGENNNSNSDNDEYSLNIKKSKNNENIMFRSRSGALPAVANTKTSFDSLLSNEEDVDVDYKIPNISARMREIDKKLEDLENQDKDGNLLKLRKQHEIEDNSVASEDLDAMEFSTGGADEDCNDTGGDILETADSSGEGSFSFLDSSSKSGRK